MRCSTEARPQPAQATSSQERDEAHTQEQSENYTVRGSIGRNFDKQAPAGAGQPERAGGHKRM